MAKAVGNFNGPHKKNMEKCEQTITQTFRADGSSITISISINVHPPFARACAAAGAPCCGCHCPRAAWSSVSAGAWSAGMVREASKRRRARKVTLGGGGLIDLIHRMYKVTTATTLAGASGCHSAYVSIRQHTSAYVSISWGQADAIQHTSAYVSIRQHTTAYVIRQHTSAYVSIRQHSENDADVC